MKFKIRIPHPLPKENQANPEAVIYLTATGFVLVYPLNYS